MGYGTTLIIGFDLGQLEKGLIQEIATIDLGKCAIDKDPLYKDGYGEYKHFYRGDTLVAEDKYGEFLFSVHPGNLVNVIKEMDEADPAPIFKPAIALLTSMIETFGSGRRKAVVILYGH